jgi:hypothetical protein
MGKEVNPASFPLPTLGEKLSNVRNELYNGRGFAIFRGVDIDSFNPVDLIVLYLGLTSYIAEKRGKQNQRGAMLSLSNQPTRYYLSLT